MLPSYLDVAPPLPWSRTISVETVADSQCRMSSARARLVFEFEVVAYLHA